MMLCMFFYYLNSGVSNNKHELIQVIVPANVTTHKRLDSCSRQSLKSGAYSLVQIQLINRLQTGIKCAQRLRVRKLS